MNDQEIFNPEELEENGKRKRELIKLVVSGEAVLIVGAGSSVRVGYVDWSGLLKELENLAIKCGDDFVKDDEQRKNNPLEYAEFVKSYINKRDRGEYEALLYNLFKPKNSPVDDLHKTLVKLPFRGILTTNYDTVLETALAEIKPSSATDNSLVVDSSSATRVHEFLRAMTDSSLTQRIAHLHGKFDPPSSIILNIEDYKHAYGLELTANQEPRTSEWTLHRKLLWAVLATRRVVFIGFSMSDPYLNKMLETVRTDLREWGQSTHSAIMSISPKNSGDKKEKAKHFKERYGVDTVFYENLDGSHLHLDHLVTEIDKECESQPTTDPSQDQPDHSDQFKDQKPKPNEDESQDVLDLTEQVNKLIEIERMNKLMERGIGDDEN